MSPVAAPKEKVIVHNEAAAKRPPMFKVLLLNDNYTTMEFVVMVLERVFKKSHDDAYRIMMNVHRQGIGVAGVYVKDIAEMKCDAVHKLARAHGFPLHCDLEPE